MGEKKVLKRKTASLGSWYWLFVSIVLIGLVLFFYISGNPHREKSKKPFRTATTPVPTIAQVKDLKSFVGVVTEVTETGVVLKTKDGKNLTIVISDSTQFIGVEKSDLSTGQEIGGSGKMDNKGIITANVIQSSQAIGKPFMR